MVAALARPQHVSTRETKSSNGIELMITFDVSRSMAGEDFIIGNERVTRLTAAKDVMRDFIDQRPSDRIGIVSFAGRPYVSGPLTLDHAWLQKTVDGIRIGLVEDGTAIGSAVALAANLLAKRPSRSKIMILLTDGSNNSGNLSPTDAARLAATLGIKVSTIAVGTDSPVRIPLPQGTFMTRTEFDIETLQEMARISKGRFFRAQDTSALQGIFRGINKMEKSDLQSRQIVEVRELFPWFVGAALALLLLAILFHECVAWVSP
jgi:Ca-activated chloride channel family protein